MKKNIAATLLALALGVPALDALAQDANQPQPPRGPRPPQRDGGPQGGPAGEGHRPPPPPLIAALDVNRDGVIDAAEIANSAAALITLDKNRDGQLTMDELRPPRPGGPGGPGVGHQDEGQPPADGQPRPQRPRRPRQGGE